MLTIQPVSGQSITIGHRVNANTVTETNPKRQTSLLSVTGHPGEAQVIFELHGYFRGWLDRFEPLAALNPVQLTNRAGVVQVRSEKPCEFCRFRWQQIPWSLNIGFNRAETEGEETGVFTVDSSMEGSAERATLTLYRADWLRLPDGRIVNFEVGDAGA